MYHVLRDDTNQVLKTKQSPTQGSSFVELLYIIDVFQVNWAGYNSLVSTTKPLTEVGAPPLLPEVAHEWSTLLTVMKQAHQLKELTLGEEYITVITYDMAIYAKAVQLVNVPSLLLGGCGMTLVLGATLKVRLLFDTQHTVYSQWFGTAVHL